MAINLLRIGIDDFAVYMLGQTRSDCAFAHRGSAENNNDLGSHERNGNCGHPRKSSAASHDPLEHSVNHVMADLDQHWAAVRGSGGKFGSIQLFEHGAHVVSLQR